MSYTQIGLNPQKPQKAILLGPKAPKMKFSRQTLIFNFLDIGYKLQEKVRAEFFNGKSFLSERECVCVCVCFAVKFNLEGIGYDLEGVHFDRFEGK